MQCVPNVSDINSIKLVKLNSPLKTKRKLRLINREFSEEKTDINVENSAQQLMSDYDLVQLVLPEILEKEIEKEQQNESKDEKENLTYEFNKTYELLKNIKIKIKKFNEECERISKAFSS